MHIDLGCGCHPACDARVFFCTVHVLFTSLPLCDRLCRSLGTGTLHPLSTEISVYLYLIL